VLLSSDSDYYELLKDRRQAVNLAPVPMSDGKHEKETSGEETPGLLCAS